MIDTSGTRTLLDYGAGKGLQYQWQNMTLSDGRTVPGLKAFWGVDFITCYDPAYPPFIALPKSRFDGVISTDVLEHCPEFGYSLAFLIKSLGLRTSSFTPISPLTAPMPHCPTVKMPIARHAQLSGGNH